MIQAFKLEGAVDKVGERLNNTLADSVYWVIDHGSSILPLLIIGLFLFGYIGSVTNGS